MDKASKSYTCASCREEFNFENVRYSRDGKRVLCLSCCNRERKKIDAAEDKSKEAGISKKTDTVRVRCLDCGYKFHLKKTPEARAMCPYCSKERLMRDDTSAQRLIDAFTNDASLRGNAIAEGDE